MVNLEGVRADVQQQPQGHNVEITVTVDTPRPLTTLPVAVWRVPLAPAGMSATSTSPNARFIFVVDGSTGNTHGLVVCNAIPQGRSTWTLHLQGQPREPVMPAVQIGPYVLGPHVYAQWSSVCLSLAGRDGHSQRYSEDPASRWSHSERSQQRWPHRGKQRRRADGGARRCRQHTSPLVTGLSAAEIQTFATFEPAQ